MIRLSVVLAACLLVPIQGWAQVAPAPTQVPSAAPVPSAAGQDVASDARGGCDGAGGTAGNATARQPGASGDDANNAGSSGWTGGLGGSHMGTNPQGASAASPTWQPPTARGLDLKGAAQPAAARLSDGC